MLENMLWLTGAIVSALGLMAIIKCHDRRMAGTTVEWQLGKEGTDVQP